MNPETEAKSARPPVDCYGFMFCENVVIDREDVLTLIRVVDLLRLGSKSSPDGTLVELPGVKLVVLLRSGPGDSTDWSIMCQTPFGKKEPMGATTIEASDKLVKTYIVSPMAIPWFGEGAYTYTLERDGLVIAKTVLQVEFAEDPQTNQESTKKGSA
jgi:hypothetical protein